MINKYLAELMGTFALTFAVALTIVSGEISVMVPLMAGLTVMLCVYTLGPISGAHVNPAVTVGLWTVKKINTLDAVFYVIAQVLGAIGAMLAIGFIYEGGMADVVAGDHKMIAIFEAIGAFVITFGVSAVAHEKVHPGAAGITVGGSVFIGALIASVSSNAIMNPAVAIGLRSVSATYLLAPIAGGIVAAAAYHLLNCKCWDKMKVKSGGKMK